MVELLECLRADLPAGGSHQHGRDWNSAAPSSRTRPCDLCCSQSQTECPRIETTRNEARVEGDVHIAWNTAKANPPLRCEKAKRSTASCLQVGLVLARIKPFPPVSLPPWSNNREPPPWILVAILNEMMAWSCLPPKGCTRPRGIPRQIMGDKQCFPLRGSVKC